MKYRGAKISNKHPDRVPLLSVIASLQFNSIQTKPKDSVTTLFRASESEKPRFRMTFNMIYYNTRTLQHK